MSTESLRRLLGPGIWMAGTDLQDPDSNGRVVDPRTVRLSDNESLKEVAIVDLIDPSTMPNLSCSKNANLIVVINAMAMEIMTYSLDAIKEPHRYLYYLTLLQYKVISRANKFTVASGIIRKIQRCFIEMTMEQALASFKSAIGQRMQGVGQRVLQNIELDRGYSVRDCFCLVHPLYAHPAFVDLSDRQQDLCFCALVQAGPWMQQIPGKVLPLIDTLIAKCLSQDGSLTVGFLQVVIKEVLETCIGEIDDIDSQVAHCLQNTKLGYVVLQGDKSVVNVEGVHQHAFIKWLKDNENTTIEGQDLEALVEGKKEPSNSNYLSIIQFIDPDLDGILTSIKRRDYQQVVCVESIESASGTFISRLNNPDNPDESLFTKQWGYYEFTGNCSRMIEQQHEPPDEVPIFPSDLWALLRGVGYIRV